MKIIKHTSDINEKFGATLGNFDGVHVGHLKMLLEAKLECDRANIKFAVITFLPHPAQILKAQRAFLLTEYDERRNLLEKAGVDYLVEVSFTKEFSKLTPEDFIKEYIADISNLKILCLGYDFAFGANKSGNIETFKRVLNHSKQHLVSLSEFRSEKSSISSSYIRELIKNGKVDKVNDFLGRNYKLKGLVVRGKGRGKGIGFPTANLQVSDEVITPSTGVYATRTYLNGEEFSSVTNIGFNPTFDDNLKMSIETHLLETVPDFYNQTIEVEFLGKIREEKRFDSIDELTKQISCDAEIARQWK